jgi:ribonuclease P protein component
MDSGAAWRRVPGGQSSNAGAPKAAPVSAPDTGQGFTTLRTRRQFDRVFSQGRRRRVGGITVITAAAESGEARVGLVVGRRVGNAVERNRAKRRLRAALAQVALPAGNDHVVIASRDVVSVPFGTLRTWLERAVRIEEDEGA